MTSELLHPALSQLLRYQAAARLRRMCRGFSTPRRLLLSGLALLLAIVWLGNMALAVLLREPTDAATLQRMVPLGLLAYGLWHVLKTACRRPEEGVEWTEAERELLGGGPFCRRDLLAYRFATIVTSAAFKASCFALLMLPDLRLPAVGFTGMLLALLFLDLLRMAVEITACGVRRPVYLRLRASVLVVAGAAAASAVATALCAPLAWKAAQSPASLGLLIRVLKAAAQLSQTWIGRLLLAPFEVFGHLITAQHYSAQLAPWLVLAVVLVCGMAWLVIHIDTRFLKAAAERERMDYHRLESAPRAVASATTAQVALPLVFWQLGMGPIAWRQAVGARRYAVSLLVALSVPSVLACLPLLVFQDSRMALLNVAGALAFYSFLLLPAALKFDFRRDIDRIAVLRTLPIRPAAVVTGQLAIGVLVASGYQLAVLLVAMLVQPIHPAQVAAALLLLVPLNVLIFALDNLIFLLYPYRPNQEGLEIFLRTTLTFTAKGLLFALALVTALAWALAAGQIADAMAVRSQTVFVLGLWVMLCLVSAAVSCLLVRAYCRFDPGRDTPP